MKSFVFACFAFLLCHSAFAETLSVSHPSGRTTEQAIPAGIEGGRVFRDFLLPSLQKQKCVLDYGDK
jgi:hypothetical protein